MIDIRLKLCKSETAYFCLFIVIFFLFNNCKKHVYKITETVHSKNLVEAHSGLNHTQYSVPGVGLKAEDGLDATCHLVKLGKKKT